MQIEPKEVVDQREVTATIVALINQANSIAEESSSVGKPILYDVQDASTYIDKTDTRSIAAKNKYNELKGMKEAHWYTSGRNKAKGEKTQDILEDLLDAVDNNANATKALFNAQIMMAEFSKRLYAIGLLSIASNRMVVREVTYRLEHASKEELSDLARRELETVLNELKRQQSIENRIDQIKTRLNDTEEKHEDLSRRVDANKTEVLSKIGAIGEAVKSDRKQLEAKVNEANEKRDRLAKEINEKYNAFISSSDAQNNRLDLLEKKSFFDSSAYKIIVGITALGALIFSLLTYLG